MYLTTLQEKKHYNWYIANSNLTFDFRMPMSNNTRTKKFWGVWFEKMVIINTWHIDKSVYPVSLTCVSLSVESWTCRVRGSNLGFIYSTNNYNYKVESMKSDKLNEMIDVLCIYREKTKLVRSVSQISICILYRRREIEKYKLFWSVLMKILIITIFQYQVLYLIK